MSTKLGRPRLPESERALNFTVRLKPKTIEGLTKGAAGANKRLSNYARQILERAALR